MAKMTLDDLVAQLRAAFGGALRAVVLYGSAAAGERATPQSDQNVLVVVDALGMAELRAVAPTIRAWGEAGHAPPLTLTTAEWRSSADVFPMEYSDVLDYHRALHGTLPVEGMQVDREHLRTQVEQQALGKLLQLRQGVLAAGGNAERQLQLLEASLGTLMTVFRGAVRLHGERPPSDYEALTQALAARVGGGEAAGFGAAPFVRVVRHVRGTERLAPSGAEAVLAGYLTAMEALVAHVDRLARGGPGAPGGPAA